MSERDPRAYDIDRVLNRVMNTAEADHNRHAHDAAIDASVKLAGMENEIGRLRAELAAVRRHDDAATQDAVFFRKRLVDTEAALKETQQALRMIRINVTGESLASDPRPATLLEIIDRALSASDTDGTDTQEQP